MRHAAGIEREAIAFIIFVAMLACLDLAWLRSGAMTVEPGVCSGTSAGLPLPEPFIKPSPKRRGGRNKPFKAVETAREKPHPPGGVLASFFMVRGCDYPPRSVTLIAVKQDGMLEVWAAGNDGVPRYIMEYPICAISGHYGPKLRRGDRQVPEGIYTIAALNPYSKYHLSLRLDYPNTFDRMMAEADGRTDLGGDIFIHGDCRSMGCLAMGDAVIEELYGLIRDAGTANTRVIIAPWDLRKKYGKLVPAAGMPDWTPRLYENIRDAMARYGLKGYEQAAVLPN